MEGLKVSEYFRSKKISYFCTRRVNQTGEYGIQGGGPGAREVDSLVYKFEIAILDRLSVLANSHCTLPHEREGRRPGGNSQCIV